MLKDWRMDSEECVDPVYLQGLVQQLTSCSGPPTARFIHPSLEDIVNKEKQAVFQFEAKKY